MAATLGIHRGVVLTTSDPAGAGRVRLKIPHIFGDTPTDWVEPSEGGGTTPVPGATVWVLFQGGDVSKPVYLAGVSGDAVVHLAGTETVTGDKNFTGALTKGGQAVVTTDDPRLATSAQSIRNDLEVLIAMGGF